MAARIKKKKHKHQRIDVNMLFEHAVAYHKSGDLKSAKDVYIQIIEKHKDHFNALHLLGVVYGQEQNLDAAIPLLNQAAQLSPNNAEVWFNLGNVYKEKNAYDHAETAYRTAIALDATHARAYNNLGLILAAQRRFEEAITCYRHSLAILPQQANAYNNLGVALRAHGHLTEAIAAYRDALRIDASHVNAYGNLSVALQEQGQPDVALAASLTGVRLDLQNTTLWEHIIQLLPQVSTLAYDQFTLNDLRHILALDPIDMRYFRRVAIRLLTRQPTVQRLIDTVERDHAAGRITTISEDDLQHLMQDPILPPLLEKTVLASLPMERLCVAIRYQLLRQTITQPEAATRDTARLAFLHSLAHQCFLNEYVYPETEHETALITMLQAWMEKSLQLGQTIPCERLALLASYRALYTCPFWGALVQDEALCQAAPMRQLLTTQIVEPLVEKELQQDMPQLTRIDNTVSQSVRSQYEENPYPRWQFLQRRTPRPFAHWFLSLFPHLAASPLAWPPHPLMLIAGCGSGRHALSVAQDVSDARVVAIDLSLASLSYSQRKAQAYDCQNIAFLQADILEMAACEHRFDVIESVGVLHHLADPLQGWRVLAQLLEPQGFMKIGLYSALARQSIYAARAFIATRGHHPTLAGIRQCRTEIMTLPVTHPVRGVTRWPDFFTTSECRDLIFHTQEHCFTLPQIATALDELGLEFLGFQFSDRGLLRRYQQRFPDDPHATSLEHWHQFETEEPTTFTGMYQFWTQKRA